MNAQDIKDLHLWIRELEDKFNQRDHSGGSHARHTDEAVEADHRARLLRRVIKEVQKEDPNAMTATAQ